MKSFCLGLALWTTLFAPLIAFAHEVRPAYLELREDQPGEFEVLWKTPMRGNRRLALEPEFSGQTKNLTPITTRETGGAAVQTWRVRAIGPLRGQLVRIGGLEQTMTDALVRVVYSDGSMWVKRLTPAEPSAQIPVDLSAWHVARVYLTLGMQHILFGIDHLLLVLALLLISSGMWPLVKTVTAFTLAHSITLALATLGFMHVPPAPVEVVIALSIVFVASEIVRMHGTISPSVPLSQGEVSGDIVPAKLTRVESGTEGTLMARAPWIVAFTFGLLHGLGFAGALSEVGLPQGHIPVALLFFNLGVEVGQLLFIGSALGLITAFRHLRFQLPRWTECIPPYAIGCMAMFWVFQRLSTF